MHIVDGFKQAQREMAKLIELATFRIERLKDACISLSGRVVTPEELSLVWRDDVLMTYYDLLFLQTADVTSGGGDLHSQVQDSLHVARLHKEMQQDGLRRSKNKLFSQSDDSQYAYDTYDDDGLSYDVNSEGLSAGWKREHEASDDEEDSDVEVYGSRPPSRILKDRRDLQLSLTQLQSDTAGKNRSGVYEKTSCYDEHSREHVDSDRRFGQTEQGLDFKLSSEFAIDSLQ